LNVQLHRGELLFVLNVCDQDYNYSHSTACGLDKVCYSREVRIAKSRNGDIELQSRINKKK
jgi:hypothetical protein